MTRHPHQPARLAAWIVGPALAASAVLVWPLVAAAQAATRHVPLADARMASTPAARQTLKYLASCALIAAQHRLCALPVATHDGKAVTACGMVHVGECTPAAFAQAGVQYRQAVTVFLPPQAPDRSRDDSAAR